MAPQSVWTSWRRRKILPYRESNTGRQARSLFIILTEIPRFLMEKMKGKSCSSMGHFTAVIFIILTCTYLCTDSIKRITSLFWSPRLPQQMGFLSAMYMVLIQKISRLYRARIVFFPEKIIILLCTNYWQRNVTSLICTKRHARFKQTSFAK